MNSRTVSNGKSYPKILTVGAVINHDMNIAWGVSEKQCSPRVWMDRYGFYVLEIFNSCIKYLCVGSLELLNRTLNLLKNWLAISPHNNF